jgi:hypothetical protein
MDAKNNLLAITNEVYRITLLFPKKEPLRYKIRELANDALSNFISLSNETSIQPRLIAGRNFDSLLEVIHNFLEVSKEQNWVKESEILSLQEGYSKIKEETKNLSEKKDDKLLSPANIKAKKIITPEDSKLDIPERQKKILSILKKKDQAQIWEIKEAFPEVSKRTLRRDFKKMLQDNIVEKIGEKNSTFYRVKART